MALMRAQRGRWGRGRAARVEGAGGGKAEGAHEGGWRREEGPPAGEGASTRASEAGENVRVAHPARGARKSPVPSFLEVAEALQATGHRLLSSLCCEPLSIQFSSGTALFSGTAHL